MAISDVRAVKLVLAFCAAAFGSGGMHVYATSNHSESQGVVVYRLDQIDKRLDRIEDRLGYSVSLGTD